MAPTVEELEARRDLSVRQLAAWLDSDVPDKAEDEDDEDDDEEVDEWLGRTLRLPLQGPPRGALRHIEVEHSLHSSLFTLVFEPVRHV